MNVPISVIIALVSVHHAHGGHNMQLIYGMSELSDMYLLYGAAPLVLLDVYIGKWFGKV